MALRITRRYWYSTPAWTVQVNTDDADIVEWTAPFLHRFVGQPRSNIDRWCELRGWPLEVVELHPIAPVDPHEPYSAREIVRAIRRGEDLKTRIEETKI